MLACGKAIKTTGPMMMLLGPVWMVPIRGQPLELKVQNVAHSSQVPRLEQRTAKATV